MLHSNGKASKYIWTIRKPVPQKNDSCASLRIKRNFISIDLRSQCDLEEFIYKMNHADLRIMTEGVSEQAPHRLLN